MALKHHDFVEIEYTGRLSDGTVFDTTRADVAQTSTNYDSKRTYKPIVVCIGEQQVVSGLDNALVGKDVGQAFSVSLTAEHAFGKKDPKLIRLVPLRTFKNQNVMPLPGLQVEVDGMRAMVLRSGGGRVMVDFNHPLAGRDIIYNVTLKREVTDVSEQLKSYLERLIPFSTDVSVNEGKAIITIAETLPSDILSELGKKIQELCGVTTEFVKKGSRT